MCSLIIKLITSDSYSVSPYLSLSYINSMSTPVSTLCDSMQVFIFVH